MRIVLCSYCHEPAEQITGKEVYPHRKDLFGMTFYQCKPCDAYVGCHPGTDKPMGRLANASLRKAKRRAHAAFDPLWKLKRMSRTDAYAFLAKQLNIPQNECHIGMFDEELCAKAVQASVRKMSEART